MRNQKGKNNNAYKDGRTLKKYYCKCGKKLSSYTVKYCKSCNAKIAWKKGILKPHKSGNYKHGKYSKISFCIDCGNKISKYPAKRCRRCYIVFNRGMKAGSYDINAKKRNTFCKDCKKKIDYRANRCKKCAGKYIKKNKLRQGRNNSRFGKPPSWKKILYNNIWFRSTWEVAYAKYLDRNHIKWFYESKTFDLGDTTYTPDFYLPETNEYIEIKGWWRDDILQKFKEFRKKFYKIKIFVINQESLFLLKLINKRGKIL